jgi:hypothetical protein
LLNIILSPSYIWIEFREKTRKFFGQRICEFGAVFGFDGYFRVRGVDIEISTEPLALFPQLPA